MSNRALRITVTVLCGLVVNACNRPEPKLDDATVEQIRAAAPGITDLCLKRLRAGGIQAWPDRVDQCYEMTKSRRWRGLYADHFEVQQFCPEPARTCDYLGGAPRIWLTFAEGQRPAEKREGDSLNTIEFVGRRTLRIGQHGHMGAFDHEIMVDRLIMMAPVGGADAER